MITEPPFGYYLRKFFYGNKRWMEYLCSLDGSTDPTPTKYTIRDQTPAEREQRLQEKVEEELVEEMIYKLKVGEAQRAYREQKERLRHCSGPSKETILAIRDDHFDW